MFLQLHRLAFAFSLAMMLSGCGEHAVPSHRESVVLPIVNDPGWPHIEFPDVSSFQRDVVANEYIHYIAPIKFRGFDAELVIYPLPGQSTITPDQFEGLRSRFDRFQAELDAALVDLPRKLRAYGEENGVDLVGDLTDESLLQDQTWSNVKLLNDGSIECYTSNYNLSFDIVLGFSPDMKLDYLHLDG
jgi:hypothetical protein